MSISSPLRLPEAEDSLAAGNQLILDTPNCQRKKSSKRNIIEGQWHLWARNCPVQIPKTSKDYYNSVMGRLSSKLIKTHRSISTIAGRTSGGIDSVRSWPNSSWCPNCASNSAKLKAFVHSLLTTMDKKQLKNQTKHLTFNPETVFGTACWKFGTICLEVNEDISKNFQRSMKKFQKNWRSMKKFYKKIEDQ